MAATIRYSILALAGLSAILSLAMLVCASHTLNIFNTQQSSNTWLLPLWPNHFDVRDLEAIIGTSAGILLLDAVLVVSTVLRKVQNSNFSCDMFGLILIQVPMQIVDLVVTILGLAVAIVAIVFSNVMNNSTSNTDTLRSWTCQWGSVNTITGQGPPTQFTSTCRETRFALYSTIPVFVIQVSLLACACFAFFARNQRTSADAFEMEKGQKLNQYHRQESWESQTVEHVTHHPSQKV